MTTDDRRQLAHLGLRLAQRLDDRGALEAGIVRQLARAVLDTAPPPPDTPPDGCRRCGAALVQKPTGRPRLYCSDRCRKGRTKPGGK